MVSLILTFLGLLLLAIAINYDDRRPISAKIKYKFRVKDNSFFRKIFKLKDKPESPYNYFKIIPIFIFLVCLIISFILFLIDLFSNKIISNSINDNFIDICCGLIIVIYYLYLVIIILWWEIVDGKEMKLTKEEKQELKKFKKKIKKQNKRIK